MRDRSNVRMLVGPPRPLHDALIVLAIALATLALGLLLLRTTGWFLLGGYFLVVWGVAGTVAAVRGLTSRRR